MDRNNTPFDLKPLSVKQLHARYLAALLFFGTACLGLVLLFFPSRISPVITMWAFLPMAATILWAKFDPDSQYLHDRIAGTRLILVGDR